MPGGRHGSSGGGGVHRARARIHPHVKHTRSSSEEHKIKGHSTHSTEATRSTLVRAPIHASHTRLVIATKKTQPPRTRAASELTSGGTRLPGPPPLRPPFACLCHTYFLHSNFSSTIFMFEEYLGESEIYALIDTYYLGISRGFEGSWDLDVML